VALILEQPITVDFVKRNAFLRGVRRAQQTALYDVNEYMSSASSVSLSPNSCAPPLPSEAREGREQSVCGFEQMTPLMKHRCIESFESGAFALFEFTVAFPILVTVTILW